MKGAEEYLSDVNLDPDFLNAGDVIVRQIRQAQADAVDYTAKRFYEFLTELSDEFRDNFPEFSDW